MVMLTMVIAPQLRLAAPGLDARLARGEDPFSSPALALRGARLASTRSREHVAAGLDHALAPRSRALSASVPVDAGAVAVARPALEQLAHALRTRDRVGVRGLALAHLLVTEPAGPLYASRYPDQLYE